ncbi:alpha/beta-hydrolase [Ramicandelaber brevisporus]|nr:alpha/beta-hydrolase [Ramicandelaber brevisporus]
MRAISLVKTAAVAVAASVRYYLKGPLRPSWPLWFVVTLAVMKSGALDKPPSSEDTSPDISSADSDEVKQQKNREFFLRRITPGTKENDKYKDTYQKYEDNTVRALGPKKSTYTVCETSFTTIKRGLPGALADVDANADSAQIAVPAEWIAATRVDGAVTAHDGPANPGERIILYSHGGAYVSLSPRTHRGITMRLSKEAGGIRVLSVEYRLAPETPYPGAFYDVVSVYLALIDPNGKYKFDPRNIIVAGDSAGGALSVALCLYARESGLPMPAAGYLISPWIDLNINSESWQRNAQFDFLNFPERQDPYHPVRLYANPKANSWEEVKHIVNNPYVSPIKAESLSGLPPLLVQYGQLETPRDEIHQFVHRIIEDNGPESVQSEEYEDMVHNFPMFDYLKQTNEAFISFGKWFRQVFESSP